MNFKKSDIPLVRSAIESIKGFDKKAFVFSNKEKIENRVYEQKQTNYGYFIGKPHGLWYSVGTGWLDFIEKEYSHPWKGYRSAMNLSLKKDSILKITNEEEMKEFEKEFSAIEPRFGINLISWEKLAKDYKGIEISPYQGRNRRTSQWYYTWDMASGCIWDTSAIKSYDIIFSKNKEIDLIR
jgi:hypothetical protein